MPRGRKDRRGDAPPWTFPASLEEATAAAPAAAAVVGPEPPAEEVEMGNGREATAPRDPPPPVVLVVGDCAVVSSADVEAGESSAACVLAECAVDAGRESSEDSGPPLGGKVQYTARG